MEVQAVSAKHTIVLSRTTSRWIWAVVDNEDEAVEVGYDLDYHAACTAAVKAWDKVEGGES